MNDELGTVAAAFVVAYFKGLKKIVKDLQSQVINVNEVLLLALHFFDIWCRSDETFAGANEI